MSQLKPNYGIDAPDVIRNFFLVGSTAAVAGAFTRSLRRPWGVFAGLALLGGGLVSLAFGTAMTAYVRRGKFRMRDYMLAQIEWQGDEQVLDIGTGRGLLVIGAARRLNTGKAIGIDIWNPQDLSVNTLTNALANAELEGVSDKVEFKSEDARKMSFPDGSIDVVLSLLCLHNIENASERAAACAEIARILKPGGIALLADYVPTSSYARALDAAGLQVESSRPYFGQAYALMWMVKATQRSQPSPQK